MYYLGELKRKAWLTTARITVALGYAYGSVKRQVLFSWLSRRRRVRIGPLSFHVPVGWESGFQPSREGDFVLRNVPVEWTDGARLWYGNLIEIRVRRPDARALPMRTGLDETSFEVMTLNGPVKTSLRIGAGVPSAPRQEAYRVLRSARAVGRGLPLVWPDKVYGRSASEALNFRTQNAIAASECQMTPPNRC